MKTVTRLTKARRNKLVSILKDNGIIVELSIIPNPLEDAKIVKLYRELKK